MTVNKLILGDNLEIMKSMETGSVDLIYLDPPFFSNRNYEVIWGDEGEVRSFQDRWAGGIEHYISWLYERVLEMHRILKPTGSIFLHCDWHANAHIRCDILEKIFDFQNFLSEIIWKRTFNSGSSKSIAKKFPMNTDTIFWYSKTSNYTFHKITRPLNKGALKRYDKVDENGRFMWVPLKTVSKERLEELRESGEIREDEELTYPRYKKYLNEDDGVLMDNIWDDIGQIPTRGGNERIGYPTQKPEALLERIIRCASNEGDMVLDPFVGGGTTIAVADRLNRKWMGIDQSVAAVRVSDLRLKNQQKPLFSEPYELVLRTYNYDVLRNLDAFEFEKRIIEEFGGIANPKQRSDLGLDGRMPDQTPIQVKRSDNIGRNVIDNFLSAVQRSNERLFEKNIAEGKVVGYIIAFSFGKGAIEEVARLKNKKQIIIELKKVSDILPYDKPPKVTLTADEIEKYKYALKATAESDAEIEFYSWDFNHNPEEGFKAEIYLDREGKQVRKFQPGEHHIAVEAVDDKGLDGMDQMKLKVKEE